MGCSLLWREQDTLKILQNMHSFTSSAAVSKKTILMKWKSQNSIDIIYINCKLYINIIYINSSDNIHGTIWQSFMAFLQS